MNLILFCEGELWVREPEVRPGARPVCLPDPQIRRQPHHREEGQGGDQSRFISTVDTGCSGKIVFFHNSLQPLPRHIAVSNSQSSQRNASVKSIGY